MRRYVTFSFVPLTSTALVCPVELERTWKSRVSAGADCPPSRDVPPLYTTMGWPPNRLIRRGGGGGGYLSGYRSTDNLETGKKVRKPKRDRRSGSGSRGEERGRGIGDRGRGIRESIKGKRM
ncbi:hypothetical protein EYF80_041077 [Liparis tanakae]|uniref:Uncharacterized protein n=1 Tax=Liparis tanakae TaxID=230148 RepID=A0A4Z2G5A8_9TELE|nr:hypothetical protein EYF80_041077 [Liparis tanakae]